MRPIVLVLILVAAVASAEPYVVVLGVAQDGGHPHAGCARDCCTTATEDPSQAHLVSCLGLIDPVGDRRFVFDATPDFATQLRILDTEHPLQRPRSTRDLGLDGIFLTHAHIGHYTGLMHLGREVAGAQGVPVYAMPGMRAFLVSNGPWSQLVTLGNIEIRPLEDARREDLGGALAVTPLRVPHRDEFSETVGFVIEGPDRRVLFVPDIDKWDRWDRDLVEVLAGVDRAYVDATFFGPEELPNRAMSEVPHPFVVETLALVADLPASERAKIRFIHLNHTNPALDPASEAVARIRAAGCDVAVRGERFGL